MMRALTTPSVLSLLFWGALALLVIGSVVNSLLNLISVLGGH